jgi:hypothetical protein
MKSSNKILLTLLILALVLPPLLFMGFRSKVRKNEYKMVERGRYITDSIPVASVKYIRVKGLGIECNILQSGNSYYTRSEMGELQPDTLIIQQINDTLVITRTLQQQDNQEQPSYYHILSLSLHLPDLRGIHIEAAATVNIDSVSKNLAITAIGGSTVNIGRYNLNDEYPKVNSASTAPRGEMETLTFTANGTTTPVYNTIQHLQIAADGGTVYIGNINHIQQLDVNSNHGAVLEIREAAIIDTFTGNFSPDTRVKASWQQMQQLFVRK